MRYLRMLCNAVVAAGLATAYVLALVLHLNPGLPLTGGNAARLLATVGVFYVVHLTVLFYIVLVVRHLVARELFSPAWTSVGTLVWLAASSSLVGAALMWRNFATFGNVLSPQTLTALNRSAVVLSIATACCLVLARLRTVRPQRRALWAGLLVATTYVSAAAPMVLAAGARHFVADARPADPSSDAAPVDVESRVRIIAIDAGSLDFITRATAEGRLPNFGRILDAGAVRYLATLHPTSSDAVWAAVATGKLPQKNGVRSAAVYQLPRSGGVLELLPDYCFASRLLHFGFLVEQPHSSATFRTHPLWNILSGSGLSVGVVAWPLTQPVPAVRGYVVSDAYHRVTLTASGLSEPTTVYPPELLRDTLDAMDAAAAETASVVPVSAADLAPPDARRDGPARTDRTYDRIADRLDREHHAHVTMVRYQSLDGIGHYFLRYAMPSEFGDVTEDERRQLGSVLDRQYAFVDDAIGRAIESLGPSDLLLVVSGYGMEPIGPGRRLLERLIGDSDISGTHDAAPDGFLLAYGGPVARGRQPARASVVDIAPTVLYFLGLPVGRDMDGSARTDLFQPSFTENHPIAYIPTYDR